MPLIGCTTRVPVCIKMSTSTTQQRDDLDISRTDKTMMRSRDCHSSFRHRGQIETSPFAADVFGLQDTFNAVSDVLATLCNSSNAQEETAEDIAMPSSLCSTPSVATSSPALFDGTDDQRRSPTTSSKEQLKADSALSGSTRRKDRNSGSRSIPSCSLTDIFSQQAVLRPSTELPIPTRYGYLEKSFAGHLYRSCLHRTLRLLGPRDFLIPDADPFRIPSRFFTATELRSSCLLKLFGPSGIPFDHVDVPYLNIGGSGTHYSRLDVCGEPHLDTEAWAMRRKTEFPDFKFDMDSEDLSSFLGDEIFRGEWFDPNDVEQYLRSAGLPVMGNPSVIQFTFKRKPRMLDVSQLIAYLSEQGICLGRSPGFRRRHIWRAIQMSSHVV